MLFIAAILHWKEFLRRLFNWMLRWVTTAFGRINGCSHRNDTGKRIRSKVELAAIHGMRVMFLKAIFNSVYHSWKCSYPSSRNGSFPSLFRLRPIHFHLNVAKVIFFQIQFIINTITWIGSSRLLPSLSVGRKSSSVWISFEMTLP